MKPYKKLTQKDIEYFQSLLGEANVLLDEKALKKYSKDMTEDLVFSPEIVVKPSTTAQVSTIMKYCNQEKLPVTPQGRKTGLSGGALPVLGGVVLALDAMDKILEIDEKNYTVTVEPFVVNYNLRKAVEEKNLFYPPDPASFRICSIGGNIAEGAGGPKCVKYGTTKDYVLNLEVVMPNGDVLWTGANTLKNVTGYNLTQLFIGSEGTLGIITKAVLRLIPKPRFDKLMIVSFSNMKDSSEAVNTILGAGIVPSSMEFMERNALLLSQEFTKLSFPQVRASTQAHLIIEFDGYYQESVEKDAKRTQELLEARFPSIEYIIVAQTDKEKEEIWKLRRAVLAAAKSKSNCKEEDIVVPRYYLPQTIDTINRLKEKYKLDFIAWGHAGDGNLHVAILQMQYTHQEFEKICEPFLWELFDTVCKQYGGAVTGEHGVGYIQRGFMDKELNPVAIQIMKSIKSTLDPNGICNPSKIFVD